MNKLVRAAALLAMLSSGAAVSIANAQTTEWTHCGNEGEYCAFTGTQEVRYGAANAYAYQTLSGGTQCTNAVFGDPAYGEAKSCSVRPVAVTWTACASEGQLCRFTGTRQVRYGASGFYNYRTLTDGSYCTNAVFGDPRPGAVKSCQYGPLVAGGGLPNGQVSADIGAPAIAGNTSHSGGAYTIRAAGADIGNTNDQFHFVYQPVTGNMEIIARVNSISVADNWSKAGIMVRESLTGASRHASVLMTARRGYAFQRRTDTGASTLLTAGSQVNPPGWVRLVRTGDLFEAYRSTNGSSWTRFGSDTVSMNETVYVGLAVTSHNVGASTTAALDSLRITPASAPTNQPPAVTLTAPTHGTSVTAPATVTLAASASDPENRMMSVDFYVGSAMLLRDTTAPYSASWSATAAGTYALRAVAHDADGQSTTSSTATVTVSTSTNQPPTVSLSTSGTSFPAPANIALAATASDPENQMARVEFYNGSTMLNSDTSAPYSWSWANVPAGTYTLTAAAFDAAGNRTNSSAVTVVVTGNGAPTVALTSPTGGSTFSAPATINLAANAADPENQMARVEFYRGTTLLGSDTSAPFSFSWSNVAAGTYTLTAAAFDAAGNRTNSTAVTVTVSTPTSTPPRQVVFTASSDHATNVTSYRLDVFTSGANPSTATPVATANLGKPTPNGSNDITVDQSTLFANLAGGNYIATVTAVGPGGSTRSATVAFTR